MQLSAEGESGGASAEPLAETLAEPSARGSMPPADGRAHSPRTPARRAERAPADAARWSAGSKPSDARTHGSARAHSRGRPCVDVNPVAWSTGSAASDGMRSPGSLPADAADVAASDGNSPMCSPAAAVGREVPAEWRAGATHAVSSPAAAIERARAARSVDGRWARRDTATNAPPSERASMALSSPSRTSLVAAPLVLARSAAPPPRSGLSAVEALVATAGARTLLTHTPSAAAAAAATPAAFACGPPELTAPAGAPSGACTRTHQQGATAPPAHEAHAQPSSPTGPGPGPGPGSGPGPADRASASRCSADARAEAIMPPAPAVAGRTPPAGAARRAKSPAGEEAASAALSRTAAVSATPTAAMPASAHAHERTQARACVHAEGSRGAREAGGDKQAVQRPRPLHRADDGRRRGSRTHAPPHGWAVEYDVRPGDTLAAVAMRAGVGARELRAANGLPAIGGAIMAGQRLWLPGAERADDGRPAHPTAAPRADEGGASDAATAAAAAAPPPGGARAAKRAADASATPQRVQRPSQPSSLARAASASAAERARAPRALAFGFVRRSLTPPPASPPPAHGGASRPLRAALAAQLPLTMPATYCTQGRGVSGTLTVSDGLTTFEPELWDPLVRAYGRLPFQIAVDNASVAHARARSGREAAPCGDGRGAQRRGASERAGGDCENGGGGVHNLRAAGAPAGITRKRCASLHLALSATGGGDGAEHGSRMADVSFWLRDMHAAQTACDALTSSSSFRQRARSLEASSYAPVAADALAWRGARAGVLQQQQQQQQQQRWAGEGQAVAQARDTRGGVGAVERAAGAGGAGGRAERLRALLASPRGGRTSMPQQISPGLGADAGGAHWPPIVAGDGDERNASSEPASDGDDAHGGRVARARGRGLRGRGAASRRSLLAAYLESLSRQISARAPCADDSDGDAPAGVRAALLPPFRPRLRGRTSRSPPPLVSTAEIEALAASLPQRHKLCDWKLLYCLEEHGCSLHTFFDRARGHAGTVLLVRDAELGALFGAFAPCEWRACKGFYGSGETLLFSLRPKRQVLRWTGANSYFMLSDESSLAIGAGGCFGLWLSADFAHGSAGECETFDAGMVAPAREFRCAAIEVYGLVAPSVLADD
ncbi:hypothetical protein KFE25_010874 [Diacronema lutheri]|uniref:Oxidation resistance protein 1 n=1 Tax=Diacronema lutheri TaxID=2081491 RepID=A0A8J5XH88_DIALT|nr:hypothetical protein KFE25_010874 [Diacronema lutheri]